MMSTGAIGERLRRYGADEGAIGELTAFVREIEPTIASLGLHDSGQARALLRRAEAFHHPVRLYTLGAMREDQRIAEELRTRMAWSARAIVVISGLALFGALLSLFFLMRENRAQRALAAVSQRTAEAAEQASQAKSCFLTMMSHELRNPLNGVLGPLALLNQSELSSRQRRLIEHASLSGHAMSQMLENLLVYGEIQDDTLATREEPMRLDALATLIHTRVAASTGALLAVHIAKEAPGVLRGDAERLCQIFVTLAEYLLESCDPDAISLEFRHDAGRLIGELKLRDAKELDWKIDLLPRTVTAVPDQLTSDSLRPLIARGLILAMQGELELATDPAGARIVRVAIPARTVEARRVRVLLATRSRALAAIYRAALRSDEVIFEEASNPGEVDVVLVDAARSACDTDMTSLRASHPKALFVALWPPGHPGKFDEVVDEPNDFEGLRAKIMRRLASQTEEPLQTRREEHIVR